METKCAFGHEYAVLNPTDNIIYCTACGDFRAATPPEKSTGKPEINDSQLAHMLVSRAIDVVGRYSTKTPQELSNLKLAMMEQFLIELGNIRGS